MSYSLKEFQSIKMYHRADQGPCPRGFHIGSKAEWQSLIDALTALGVYNVSNITTVLNIPSAYYLARSNGSLETRYGICRFWTSTMTSNTTAWAWGIDENNNLIFQSDKPGNAFSIRPFKDEPVIPDSSWTEFPYGVFKNTTLGLISIQNASNWITISDKNLGATNVGDDGLYYQFGNNYGFTVNPTPYYTSKVSNTQAYGPSNYYNDDHFVRVSSGNNWFTDTNNNIRGGVDTTSLYPTEAKEVWLGNHRVRPSGWQPGANTLLYLKFVNNLNDSSGNNVSVSGAGISYGTIGDKYYVEMTGSWNGTYIQPTASIGNVIGTGDFCVSFYGYPIPNTSSTYWGSCFFMNWYDGANPYPGIYIQYGTNTGYPRMGTNVENYDNPSLSANQWHYFCMTRRSGTIYCYIDGELKGTVASTRNLNNMDRFFLLNRSSYNGHARPTTGARMSEVIYEKQGWEETEMLAYYNQTKSQYGIS